MGIIGMLALPTFVGGLLAVALGQGGRPARQTIVGEVIDISSYAIDGARGETGRAQGQFRAENGFPIGLLDDESGEVYVAVYRNPAPASGLQTANELLLPYVGKKVTAQGTIHRAKGINVIQIAIVGEY